MAKPKGLVLEHLENVAGGILEEYPGVVRQMIKNRSGIYALYRRGNLYYVGLASNLMARLKHHLRDRHRGSWDRFSVYLTAKHSHMKELESLILRIVGPRGNKTKGKFADSDNLRNTLYRLLKEWDADRRARLMGGHVARRRRRVKTKKEKGTRVLAGVVERSIVLRARYRGQEYKARLLKTGEISFGRKRYDSPTGAAKAIVGHGCNGWRFWEYRNEKRKWVPLKELKN
jgi:hypothetical protein